MSKLNLPLAACFLAKLVHGADASGPSPTILQDGTFRHATKVTSCIKAAVHCRGSLFIATFYPEEMLHGMALCDGWFPSCAHSSGSAALAAVMLPAGTFPGRVSVRAMLF